MAQKRLYSEAYDEPVSASKATKFSTPPSAKSKFDSPRLFDPRYQASEEVHQEHGDDDDVEVDPDFTDDEDEDHEKPGKGKDADETYQYSAEGEDDSSDEDNDDETDESYSEDDGTLHDSGYGSTPASNDEEAESSADAPQETFPFANVLQLKNMRTHNITYWLNRRRYDANFPSRSDLVALLPHARAIARSPRPRAAGLPHAVSIHPSRRVLGHHFPDLGRAGVEVLESQVQVRGDGVAGCQERRQAGRAPVAW